MHPIILGVIIIELIIIGAVGLYYLERPSAKDRKGYFIFLVLLVLLNITNSCLPNPDLKISSAFQYIIRNTIGFTTICYLPYLYFNKLETISINKKVKMVWSNQLFFIVPYPLIFTIFYSTYNDLEIAHRFSLLVPCLNNIAFLASAGKNIRDITIRREDGEKLTMELLAFGTILSWIFLHSIMQLNGGKELETIFINLGPIAINIFLLYNWLKTKHIEYKNFQSSHLPQPSLNLIINNCQKYSLSDRETEIAILLCHRYKRQQIADKLFISIRTVDKHIERIFLKSGVSSRDSLFEKLSTLL